MFPKVFYGTAADGIPENNTDFFQLLQSEIYLFTGQLNAAQNYFNSISINLSDDLKPRYLLLKAEIEIPLYEKVLAYTGGNKLRAAKMLGLSRQTLYAKLEKYKDDIEVY